MLWETTIEQTLNQYTANEDIDKSFKTLYKKKRQDEYHVLAIEPLGLDGAQEELGSILDSVCVCVRARA